MEKALQQILQELNDLRANQVIISTQLEELKEIKKNQMLMNTQLGEHGKILSSLQTSTEFHKADNDNLVHQMANLSGEIKNSLKEILETNKSLQEMYGQHESDIRTLKRRPV